MRTVRARESTGCGAGSGPVAAVRCANATAAAVATLSESTPGAIGMRTRASAAAVAAGVRPGPSAPSSTAHRSGGATDAKGVASALGVKASRVKPLSRNVARAAGQDPGTHGERHVQYVAHRDPDTPPVERVGALLIEEDGIQAEGGGVPEQRAEVLEVVERLEDGDPAGPGQEVGDRGGRKPVRRRQNPASQPEADHIRQQPPIGAVDGQVGKAGQGVRECGEPSRLTEHRSRPVPRREQSLHNSDALGNDHPAPIRPYVRVGQVAEIR